MNMIWREIMRKENDMVKKKLNAQIQDYRRQLVTKKSFDEEAACKEITRLKREIRFLQKQNGKKVEKPRHQMKENHHREDSALMALKSNASFLSKE